MRQERKRLVAARGSNAFPIGERVWEDLARRLGRVRSVAAYFPTDAEPDPTTLATLFADSGAELCYPRLDGGELSFREIAAGIEVEPRHRFRQPKADNDSVVPQLVLVPLVAFDRRLRRLGQGGGHYDRALWRLPAAFKLGLAWSVQEVAEVPSEAHDIALDAIITEAELIIR